MWSMMLWGLSSTSSIQLSHFLPLWQPFYLLRWWWCFILINVHLKKKSFPYLTFGFKTVCLCGCYAYVDCRERVWIWGKSWWARFLWDWRWGNQGRNTTKPGRVPIFLCKFSFRLKVFLFLNSSCQLGLCLLFSVTIKLSCMN